MKEPFRSPRDSATTIASTSDIDVPISGSAEKGERQTPLVADFGDTLPQTDSSVQAYLFLVGAFAIEAIMWGEYPLSRAWDNIFSYHEYLTLCKRSVAGHLQGWALSSA